MCTSWSIKKWQQQGQCVPRGAKAPTGGVWSQCPPLGALDVTGPASGNFSWAPSGGRPPTSGAKDNCGGLPQPPAGHARTTSSCLSPGQGALSCRFLGVDSDQAPGNFPEHLAVALTGRVYSQGSKRNNRWCSLVMSFSMVPSEVVGAARDFCSGIPSDSGPCPPLESEITVAVCPCHLQAMQEAPCPS